MPVKRALLLTALAAASLFVAGCGSRDDEVVGTWKNKDEDLTMTFNRDYTMTGNEGPRTTTGKWFVHGDHVKITDVSVNGKLMTDMLKEQIDAIHSTKDPHKEIELEQTLNPSLTLSGDGKTMLSDQEVGGHPQTFIKVKTQK